MNILLTSVGRRNYLVDYFKDSLREFGGKVFAVNSHEHAPGLYHADAFAIAPIIHSEKYIPFLVDYCQKNEIRVIIPLLDNDLPILVKSKSIFEALGIFVLVSEEWLVQMANDKYKTFLFLNKFGFPTAPTFTNITSLNAHYTSLPIPYPLIVKPRWGMGSLSVYEVDDEEELTFFIKKARKEILNSFLKYESRQAPEQEILIMPKIMGDEYMLDIVNDLDGNHIVTVVNKKLIRKGGETEAVETVSHPILEALGAKIASITKHPLVMDVDVIFNGETPYILEFNPRFSGGYPFSHCAGINLPKALIHWLKALPVEPTDCFVPIIGTMSMKGFMIVEKNKPSNIIV